MTQFAGRTLKDINTLVAADPTIIPLALAHMDARIAVLTTQAKASGHDGKLTRWTKARAMLAAQQSIDVKAAFTSDIPRTKPKAKPKAQPVAQVKPADIDALGALMMAFVGSMPAAQRKRFDAIVAAK